MTIIDRYIARLIWPSFLSMLGLAVAVLLLVNMLKLFDFVIDEGGPFTIVWQMLANTIPSHFSIALPLSLSLGLWITFRKLADNSELDILHSSGLGYWRLLRIPFVFTLATMVVNIFVIGFMQPYGLYNNQGLMYELRSGAMGKMMKAGEYNMAGDNIALRFDESYDEGRRLKNVFVSIDDGKGLIVSATATEGQFLATEDLETIVLRLSNGILIHESSEFETSRVLTFTNHDLVAPFPKNTNFRLRGADQYEETLPELLEIIRNPKSTAEKKLAAESNLHFRIAIIAGMIYIPFLAFGLSISSRRNPSSLGFLLTIIITVVQLKVWQAVDGAGAQGEINIWWGYWGNYGLFLLLALWIYYIAAYIPGGQPIGWLERFALWVGTRVSALMVLFRRKTARLGV